MLGSLGAARRAYQRTRARAGARSAPQGRRPDCRACIATRVSDAVRRRCVCWRDLAGFGGDRERGLPHGRGGRALSERRADERALHAHPHLQPRGALRRCAARDRRAAAAISAQSSALARGGQHGAAGRAVRATRARRSKRGWRGSPAIRGRARRARTRAGGTRTARRSSR